MKIHAGAADGCRSLTVKTSKTCWTTGGNDPPETAPKTEAIPFSTLLSGMREPSERDALASPK
jgi:hypothetical protein